jgi:hypothetical protein
MISVKIKKSNGAGLTWGYYIEIFQSLTPFLFIPYDILRYMLYPVEKKSFHHSNFYCSSVWFMPIGGTPFDPKNPHIKRVPPKFYLPLLRKRHLVSFFVWGKHPFKHFLPDGFVGAVQEWWCATFQSSAEREMNKYKYQHNMIFFRPFLCIYKWPKRRIR